MNPPTAIQLIRLPQSAVQQHWLPRAICRKEALRCYSASATTAAFGSSVSPSEQQHRTPPPLSHFRPVKVTDVAPVLKPSEPKWKQMGMRIERNCSNELYKKLAKEIVDLYGWDNSEHDYAMWQKIYGPKFSLFFVLDQSSNPVGSASMCVYPEVAQISMYYVNEHFRGLQIGHALCRRAFEQSGDLPVFCYGVADMWAKYADELGMHHFLDWHLWTMYAHCADVRPERLDDDSSVALLDWQTVPFDELANFDRKQTAGVDRSAYLREALAHPQSAAKVAVSKETGKIVGTCQVRQLINRRLGISLFYADDSSTASALLRAVLLQFAGPDPSANHFTSLIYKTPSNNADSVRLLHQLVQHRPLLDKQELHPQFSRHALPFPGQRIYSIGDEHASLI